MFKKPWCDAITNLLTAEPLTTEQSISMCERILDKVRKDREDLLIEVSHLTTGVLVCEKLFVPFLERKNNDETLEKMLERASSLKEERIFLGGDTGEIDEIIQSIVNQITEPRIENE